MRVIMIPAIVIECFVGGRRLPTGDGKVWASLGRLYPTFRVLFLTEYVPGIIILI